MSADSTSGNKSFWPVKTALKEKIIVIYDSILSVSQSSVLEFDRAKLSLSLSADQGDQPWIENGHFWDDFFLLKVNAKYLLEELERAYTEKPAVLKVRRRIASYRNASIFFVSSVATEHDVRSMFDLRQFDASHSTTERLLRRFTDVFVPPIDRSIRSLDDLRADSRDQSRSST